MQKQQWYQAASVATITLLAACSDSPQPTESPMATSTTSVQQQLGTPEDVDVEVLARAIPGFGGYFLDQGKPTVYLKDASRAAAVASALGIAASELAVRRADFDYQQLTPWFDRMSREGLSLPGVAFVDLDESTNRVLVGVERGASGAAASAPQAVQSLASRLGIPTAALVVRPVEPIRYALTLQQRTRPVRGGFQINFPGFLCTLGFNATSGTTRSWITNSHCTTVQGGVESTLYWQPAQSATNFIGTEVADPAYFVGGQCPLGRQCRFSDASRGAYDAAATSTLGRIGRTTGANNGSLTIGNPANFTITGTNTSSNFAVGTVLNKVGRTTGWSQGPVTNTCVNTNVSGSLITQLCQTFVLAGVNSGDSGSPVFRINSGTNVRLFGILWGGSGTSLFVFSPFGQVQQELGPLTVF